MRENEYDLIVIGSGIGGLTVASLFSQIKNQRVLVLESHFKLGGFTHTFRREGKYEWDVGLHYLGNLENGSMLRRMFDSVTEGKLEFNKMPHIFEKFVFDDFIFELPSSEDEYKQKLISMFPEEKLSIEKYFQDIKEAASWFSSYVAVKSLPEFLSLPIQFFQSFLKNPSQKTTAEYLNENFKSPTLKSILTAQWGDYGLPPSKSSFVIHALIVTHYLNGGFYPKGSAKKIAEIVKTIVERHGGKLLVNHEVEQILFQHSKAIGVRVKEKKGKSYEYKTFFAPIIVSDTGAYTTYKKLISPSLNVSFLDELEKLIEETTSTVILFLGLKDDPKKLGFQGENYWIYSSIDFEEVYNQRNQVIEGRPTISYLSFPSLKNTQIEGHTAEVISFVDYEPFEKWSSTEWKNRRLDYMQLKEQIIIGLIDSVEKKFPGFNALIDYAELSTPLTNVEFTGHPKGSIYGLACVPERFSKKWLGPKTPFENFYLTGSDVCTPGIAGALSGGYMTLLHILGLDGFLQLIKKFIY